jgi:hypothetical protein
LNAEERLVFIVAALEAAGLSCLVMGGQIAEPFGC